MYFAFRCCCVRHAASLLWQVETIGDAYMVVAGAPEKTKYHAHNICDMALDMVRSIDHLKDPSNGNHIQIRVGGLIACVQVCVFMSVFDLVN